ncbi:MAG: DUF6783 domain-containing protein [Lacrimispora saccharolytica]
MPTNCDAHLAESNFQTRSKRSGVFLCSVLDFFMKPPNKQYITLDNSYLLLYTVCK